MSVREPVSRSLRISSLAALVGLIPHYIFFYVTSTPLLTDEIAEWIMARTPSRYTVAILNQLGPWAKPSAETGALAALGFCLLISRLSGSVLRNGKLGASVTVLIGMSVAVTLSWFCGYSSLVGSLAFWVPALAVLGILRYPRDKQLQRVSFGRRQVVTKVAQFGLPLVMTGGVIAIAAESFFRDKDFAARATQPTDLFPFRIPPDRESFGPGLVRKEITPVREFYGMSKDPVDPVIDPRTWKLSITLEGRIIRQLRYSDLLGMERQLRYVTLRCISNTLKSDLMGTAQWAAVRLAQLLDCKTLPAGIIEVAFIGTEGHDDSLKIDYAYSNDVLLAFGMNGKTLSRTHGFPLRLLAPRYYGCRNVKWIHEIRFVRKPYFGTWQRLGYTAEPVIHIASHIDRLRRNGPMVEFGGVSFAGSRSIKAVRVRANNGPWESARLEPALSAWTWTRWVAQLRADRGAKIEANAQDACGAWQELTVLNPFPNGPAGPTIVIAQV